MARAHPGAQCPGEGRAALIFFGAARRAPRAADRRPHLQTLPKLRGAPHPAAHRCDASLRVYGQRASAQICSSPAVLQARALVEKASGSSMDLLLARSRRSQAPPPLSQQPPLPPLLQPAPRNCEPRNQAGDLRSLELADRS